VRSDDVDAMLSGVRLLLVALITLAVAIVGAGTGSGAPHQGPIATTYRFAAALEVSLFVGWSREEGDETSPCTVWAHERGTNRVVARSVRRLKGSATIYPPGVSTIRVGGRRIPVAWATLSALGRAKGTATRTTTQTSGVTPGCGPNSNVQPKRFPPLECGERAFSTRTASIVATDRVFDRTLDPGKTRDPSEALSRLYKSSIDVWVAPARDPFRNCDVAPTWAKRFPTDVGLALDSGGRNGDQWALAYLKKGRTVTLEDSYGGRCTVAVGPRDCSFALRIEVKIKRLS
jgi:hypothetical protein